ncbi:Nitrilase/cyanide hydratase and apolipoprotein N-acyltransferase, partial [mine drainage metagenome]
PDGRRITSYRKVHLWQEEQLHFAAGDELVMGDIAGVPTGLGICWDVAFPEWGRAYALRGAELLLLPTAWDLPTIREYDMLVRARALENGVFLIGCNHAGSDGDIEFGGHSQIVDPRGEVLAFAGDNSETVLIAELDLSEVGRSRALHTPYFRDRKPAVYDRVRRT